MDSCIGTRPEAVPDVSSDRPTEELAAIDQALRSYTALAARLYDSLLEDPVRYARFKALTSVRVRRTLKGKVD
jgi:hypothetical protein